MILEELPNPNYRLDVFSIPKCRSKRIRLIPFESCFGPFWFTFFLQRRPSFRERSLIRKWLHYGILWVRGKFCFEIHTFATEKALC